MLADEHDGHAGHVPDAPLEALVAGGYDEAAMLLHAREQAVVRVGAFVQAREPLHARVARHPTRAA